MMMMWLVLFWGAIIVGVAWLVRGSPGGWRERRSETPLEILERRFAEGAITADEYHERRDLMTGGSSSHRRQPEDRARP